MAERMGLDRDIALIEMTGVRAHFDQITTARALPVHAPAQLPAQTPAQARPHTCPGAFHVRTFSPQVRVHASAGRRVEPTV